MSATPVGATQAEVTRERIRADILEGVWAPGEKLALGALADRYETSSTVVREALSRLAGEKFVHVKPNIGFSVPELSLDAFRDLTEVRCTTDGLATRLAIERGDVEWESEVLSVHHRLMRTRRQDDPAEWTRLHRRFHDVVISACRVDVLISLSGQLFDATELYRRWMGKSTRIAEGHLAERDSEHQVLVDAILDRDVETAVQVTRRHYEAALDVMRDAGL